MDIVSTISAWEFWAVFSGMTLTGLLMVAYLQSWNMRDVGWASVRIVPITLLLSWLLYANSVSISEYKRAGEATAQAEEV